MSKRQKPKIQKGQQTHILPKQVRMTASIGLKKVKDSVVGQNPKKTQVSKESLKQQGKGVKKMSKNAIAARKRTTLSNAAETMFRRQRSV